MKYELYNNESNYDSSKNTIDETAAEQINRIKNQKIGATILDIFRM